MLVFVSVIVAVSVTSVLPLAGRVILPSLPMSAESLVNEIV